MSGSYKTNSDDFLTRVRFLAHASTNRRGIAADGEPVALAPLNT
jgi:hypothetical protein